MNPRVGARASRPVSTIASGPGNISLFGPVFEANQVWRAGAVAVSPSGDITGEHRRTGVQLRTRVTRFDGVG